MHESKQPPNATRFPADGGLGLETIHEPTATPKARISPTSNGVGSVEGPDSPSTSFCRAATINGERPDPDAVEISLLLRRIAAPQTSTHARKSVEPTARITKYLLFGIALVGLVSTLLKLHFAAVSVDALAVFPGFSKTRDGSIVISLGPCNITTSDPTVPTIDSWGAKVMVGKYQEICMSPSTVMNSSVLMMEDSCDEDSRLNLNSKETMSLAQCRSRRGNLVKYGTLLDTTAAGASRVGYPNANWGAPQPTVPFAYYVNAAFQLFPDERNNVSTWTTFMPVQKGQKHEAATLGIGSNSTILDDLFSANRITSRSFSLMAGSTCTKRPGYSKGHLIFGGYDASAVDGAFYEYSMSHPKVVNDRACSLHVSVDSLVLRAPGQDNITLIAPSQRRDACLEPYDNVFRMPSHVTDRIKKFLVRNPDVQPVGLPADPSILAIEPGWVYRADDTRNDEWSLDFTLNGDFTVSVPSYEVFRPFRGLAANGSFVVRDDLRELQILHEQEDDAQDFMDLGRILLSQMYIVANYDTWKLSLGHVRPPSEITPLADIRTLFRDNEGRYGLQQGEPHAGLAAVTVGLVAVGVVLALLILVIAMAVALLRSWGCRPFAEGREASMREKASWWHDQAHPSFHTISPDPLYQVDERPRYTYDDIHKDREGREFLPWR